MNFARATTRAEFLTIGIATTTISVGAFTVGPGLLRASSETPPVAVSPTTPELASACDAIRSLIDGSREILRVWNADDTGFEEVLLWQSDTHDPDVINRDELVLLTFSESMGTLASYTCEGDPEPDLAGELGVELTTPAEPVGPDPCTLPVPRSSISDRFSWTWRSVPGVRRRVVATRLASFSVEGVRESESGSGWRIGVVWGTDSAEDEGEACAFVVARDR